MVFWSKKKKHSVKNDNHETPTKETIELAPNIASENTLDTQIDEFTVKERQFWNSTLSQEDWVNEIYEEQLKKGAFDNLPGKGKPLEIQSGEVLSSILKNANVLPGWLLLQNEIRDQFQQLLSTLPDSDEPCIEQEIEEINIKIKKYNNMVPTSILHKRTITRDNMDGQYQHWV